MRKRLSEQEQRIELGKEITEGRKALDLTQEEFAKMLRITTRTLARYESGDSVPDAIVYRKMLAYFENIYHQDGLYIDASQAKRMISHTVRNSQALKLIQSMIFNAILYQKETVSYPGLLSHEEFRLLSLIYKVTVTQSHYIISI